MERRNLYKALFASAAGIALLSTKKAEAQTCIAPCFPTTAAETAAGVTPTDFSVPPYHAKRYGFRTDAEAGATTPAAQNTLAGTNATALQNAVLAATAARARLRIGGGTFRFRPSTTLDLTCDVEGEGQEQTAIACDPSSLTCPPSGCADVVLWHLGGGRELRDLSLHHITLARVGIGLRIGDINPTVFAGHIRVTRVLVQYFNANIAVDSTFMVVFDQIRSLQGNEGFYCAPQTNGGDNGYVTTHQHLNCYYGENARNIYYWPAINSTNVSFVGGGCEHATGTNGQALFNNLINLQISSWYVEGASATYGIMLFSVNAQIQGLYLHDTGGVYLGTNAQVMFTNVLCAGGGTTNRLLGGNSTQWVQMQQCFWPSSGNVLTFAHLNMTQVQINGTFY